MSNSNDDEPFTVNSDGSYSIFGNKVTVDENGAPQIHSASINAVIQMNSDGTVSLNLASISRIAIANILDVASYITSTVGDRRMHQIEFVNGAQCEVTYTLSGTLEVFHTNGRLQCSVQPGGIIELQLPDQQSPSP